MDGRHHRAQRDVQVVFIEVPVAGSPAPLYRNKPGQYPQQRREHWRPATRIPSKAEATARLLRDIAANEMAVRSMLTPRPQPR
jgi:hypothetical protein